MALLSSGSSILGMRRFSTDKAFQLFNLLGRWLMVNEDLITLRAYPRISYVVYLVFYFSPPIYPLHPISFPINSHYIDIEA